MNLHDVLGSHCQNYSPEDRSEKSLFHKFQAHDLLDLISEAKINTSQKLMALKVAMRECDYLSQEICMFSAVLAIKSDNRASDLINIKNFYNSIIYKRHGEFTNHRRMRFNLSKAIISCPSEAGGYIYDDKIKNYILNKEKNIVGSVTFEFLSRLNDGEKIFFHDFSKDCSQEDCYY